MPILPYQLRQIFGQIKAELAPEGLKELCQDHELLRLLRDTSEIQEGQFLQQMDLSGLQTEQSLLFFGEDQIFPVQILDFTEYQTAIVLFLEGSLALTEIGRDLFDERELVVGDLVAHGLGQRGSVLCSLKGALEKEIVCCVEGFGQQHFKI